MLRMLLLLVLAPYVAAQVEWTPTYGGRANHVLFHDAVRDVTVLFGGNSGAVVRNDAWQLAAGASAWTELEFEDGPEPLEGSAVAYDSLRQHGVMFGGRAAAGARNTTWIWDGGGVNGPPVVTKPDPRYDHAMAFDEWRGKIVMFGGTGGVGQKLGDTWEWDGVDWARRTPSTNPTPRAKHAMAYDPTLGRVVLFGGNDAVRKNDLWGWNGNDWVLHHDGSGPSAPIARDGSALARDSQSGGVVLFGGSYQNDTWVWANSSWTLRSPANVPPRRMYHRAAFVPSTGRVLIAGGHTIDSTTGAYGTLSDVWEWDGSDWTIRVAHHTPFDQNDGYAIAYDEARDRVVMFGVAGCSLPDLWEWDGSQWMERATAGQDIAFAAIVYDRSRRRVVVAGGRSPSCGGTPVPVTDVWSWDGNGWQQLQSLPEPRHAPVMAYDTQRDRIVLFGGWDGTSYRNQTWEASGDQGIWTERTPSTSPPPGQAEMAYDEARRRIVQIASRGGGAAEHWEWDGNDWAFIAPVPFTTYDETLAYDRARARLVMRRNTATLSVGQANDEVWEFDGNDWVLRGESPAGGNVVYDATRSKIVAVSRDTSVWYYGPTSPATYATFGTGCVGSAGIPALRGTQLPWTGCPFSLEFDNLPAHPGIVWIGFSNSDWNGLPLPFDLSQIGVTGCLLYTGIETSFPIVGDEWTFVIPNLASLLGGVFYNQALILDPGTNPFGAVVTNGGEAVIGGSSRITRLAALAARRSRRTATLPTA